MASPREYLRHLSGFTTRFRSGFLHPLLGYSMSPDQAFGVLRQFLADSRHRFIPDDLSCEDRVVRTDLMGGANQVTDHYLVALAQQHRLNLATFDEPLVRAFAGEAGLVQLVR